MSKGIFGIEVVRGYYDVNNFTKGMPIRITIFLPPLGFNQCLLYSRAANETAEPLFVSYYGTNYYVFKPDSDMLNGLLRAYTILPILIPFRTQLAPATLATVSIS